VRRDTTLRHRDAANRNKAKESHIFFTHKRNEKKPLVQEKTGAKEQYIVKMNLARPILRVRLQ
jgi:hypothetical protein